MAGLERGMRQIVKKRNQTIALIYRISLICKMQPIKVCFMIKYLKSSDLKSAEKAQIELPLKVCYSLHMTISHTLLQQCDSQPIGSCLSLM